MFGTRERQRPQKRWTNELEEDLKIMGIRYWNKMARGLEEDCLGSQGPQQDVVFEEGRGGEEMMMMMMMMTMTTTMMN